MVCTREIYLRALQLGAVGIIIVHNHPSGDSSLSKEDEEVAEKVKNAGEILNVTLLDSIVTGKNEYTPCKEKGII